MYKYIESMVIDNGNSGKLFKLQSGVAYECPLSAYSFINAFETLADKIRNDN